MLDIEQKSREHPAVRVCIDVKTVYDFDNVTEMSYSMLLLLSFFSTIEQIRVSYCMNFINVLTFSSFFYLSSSLFIKLKVNKIKQKKNQQNFFIKRAYRNRFYPVFIHIVKGRRMHDK